MQNHNQSHGKKSRSEIILGFKEMMKLKRTPFDVLADFMTNFFGTVSFLILNALLFLAWILINLEFIPGISPFDPFPFGLLTMIVSLEAIFLSIIVLISQNRETKVADLREELDFAINVRSEEEVTRMINMLDEIHDHLGLDPKDDPELANMKKQIDIEKMGERMMKE